MILNTDKQIIKTKQAEIELYESFQYLRAAYFAATVESYKRLFSISYSTGLKKT